MAHYNVSEVPLLVREREARRLHKAGVHSTEDVLAKSATARDREALASSTGLPRATIETLARRSDLLRLDDVAPNHVLLLQAAGVKSVADLGARDPTHLARTLAAIQKANRNKKADIAPVPEAQVRAWIAQAKRLPTVLAD